VPEKDKLVLTVVMVVENVLRLPHSEAITETGNGLYKALTACRLYLLTATWSEDDLTTWLHRRQLSGHQGILYAPDPGAAARIDTLRRVRSWRIGLVIDADAQCAAAAVADGWTVHLHAPAVYPEPAWRPDHIGGIRPWGALLDEVQHQEDMRNRPPKGDPR
jgi:hypothetical protein